MYRMGYGLSVSFLKVRGHCKYEITLEVDINCYSMEAKGNCKLFRLHWEIETSCSVTKCERVSDRLAGE